MTDYQAYCASLAAQFENIAIAAKYGHFETALADAERAIQLLKDAAATTYPARSDK